MLRNIAFFTDATRDGLVHVAMVHGYTTIYAHVREAWHLAQVWLGDFGFTRVRIEIGAHGTPMLVMKWMYHV
jgi:hypothetical protein